MKPMLSRLSIRQRLPLLICILLLTIILIFGFTSYIGVKKAALKVGHDRLQSLSDQLSIILAGSARSAISYTYVVANKPAIKKFLVSNGKDSAAEALKLLEALRTDTLYELVELRNSDRVQTLNSTKAGVRIKTNIDSLLLTSPSKPDSGGVGKLYKIDT